MKSDVTFGFENAGWPALLIDGSGTIGRANPAAVKLFGAALEGSSARLGAIWAPENSVGADQFLPQWERTPTPTLPLKFRGKGGNTFSRLCSMCSTLREGEKHFVLQLLPETAPAATAPKNPGPDGGVALKQKLDCALQLARTVSLDFNNALTGILGHTSLLLSQLKPEDPARGSLLEVEKCAARAAELANDLASFSRQEKEPKEQVAGNLNLLLERTVGFFQQQPGTVPIQWKLSLDKQLFAARFDEAKLQQALVKVVENAVESLPGHGGITVQSRNVELSEQSQDRNVHLPAGAYVCLEISDNGCGIAPETLPRIFEPFFTTKKAPHRGVGLALVYGIVTNHGGGVAVSSHPGMGTSVRVYLPALTELMVEDGKAATDLRGSETILMVDDEEVLLTMGRRILSAFGYRVLTANSGQKALEMLSTGEADVDLVITDMVMPAMSGRELVEHIRRVRPATRVMCTSGYFWPGAQENEDAFLKKPFTAQQLLLKVKQNLA